MTEPDLTKWNMAFRRDGKMKLVRSPRIRFALILSAFVATGPLLGAQHTSDMLSPNERLAKAEAMFQERCKRAGEKIYRTVANVEGILLMKVRPESTNYGDQFRMDDPYGHDSTGTRYIESFLLGRGTGGYLTRSQAVKSNGYKYVDVIDANDGKRYRYTGSIKEVTNTSSVLMGGDGKTRFVSKDFVVDKVFAPGIEPRFGVTYDDISTREEREHWIAGSSLKILDLKRNEVIAERLGYMMDPHLGSRLGGRSPWLLAANHACPKFPKNVGGADQIGQARNFVEKVLVPAKER